MKMQGFSNYNPNENTASNSNGGLFYHFLGIFYSSSLIQSRHILTAHRNIRLKFEEYLSNL